MPYSIERIEVWAAPIEDQAGGLAEKVQDLADAGANFEFVLARRSPAAPGKGVVFVTPLKGAKQKMAARQDGYQQLSRVGVVRILGANPPGLTAKITGALAQKNLSLRGFTATAI